MFLTLPCMLVCTFLMHLIYPIPHNLNNYVNVGNLKSRMQLLFRPGDDQSLPHLLITLVSAGPGPSGARRPLSSGSRLEEALDELLNPLNTNSIEFTMTASMLFPCVRTRYCARTPRHPTGKGQKKKSACSIVSKSVPRNPQSLSP